MTGPAADSTGPRVVVCDYGVGNLRSVERALLSAGARVEVSGNPDTLLTADGVVLPGVGAFGAAVDALDARGLRAAVLAVARSGRPLLGVCVGYQLLFEESEENGGREGLGVLPGRVVRIGAERGKVPHMGWNRLRIRRRSRLLEGIDDGAYVYFVHSYEAVGVPDRALVADTEYSGTVPALVESGSVAGTQFHPEKSGADGLRLYANFAALCGGMRREMRGGIGAAKPGTAERPSSAA